MNDSLDELVRLKTNMGLPADIDKQRDQTKEFMRISSDNLQKAMFLSMLCFGFPVKTLLTLVYASKTKTEYKLKTEDLFDVIICTMITAWIYIFFSFRKHETTNPKIAETPDEIFMYDIIMARKKNTFHFDFLLACIASMFWLRMILMLKLTKTFGPLIRIIDVMLKELGIFLVLWVIQLFIFACVGVLIFGELPEYKNFIDVLIMLFQSALGQWDLSIYEKFSMGRHFGEFFHLIVIILNMVLLINLVIAILSETYTRLSEQKLGLYYDGVIEVIPAYKYRKFYGALIAACPPFNLLILPFLPIFWCNSKK